MSITRGDIITAYTHKGRIFVDLVQGNGILVGRKVRIKDALPGRQKCVVAAENIIEAQGRLPGVML